MSADVEDQADELGAPRLTPLQMAQNAAAAVLRYADYQIEDPVRAYIDKAGTQGQHSAELAGQMALVSIAESLDAIRAMLAVELDRAQGGAGG